MPNLLCHPMVARMVCIRGHILAAVVLAVIYASTCRAAAAEGLMVLAGVTGGICAAQFQTCTARCHGSGVCTARCVANDRACRVGGKPIYR